MFLIAKLGLCTANPADGILDFTRLQMFAASLVAFISPGLFSAIRTGAFHVPVRKEPPARRAERLVYYLFVYIPVFLQPAHYLLSPEVICWIIGHTEVIKTNTNPFERFVEMPVVLFRKCPGSNTPLFC